MYRHHEVHARHTDRRILVTGATGYVGGRLVPALLDAGFTVRTMSRKLDRLKRFTWFDQVEAVEADFTDTASMEKALDGVDVVYYLVHSMGDNAGNFQKVEEDCANILAQAAQSTGVKQIVYLSGLHPEKERLEDLSTHMSSRARVGRILLDSAVSTIVLRAATLIGSGSASFEIIRHLAERLPLIIGPRGLNNKIEPIGIRDALYYLTKSADLDEPLNRPIDIGCGVVYTYADLMRLYAKERGLWRVVKALPFTLPTDKIAGLWISLFTPVPSSLARPLGESMAEDAVTGDRDIAEYIPDPEGGLADYPLSVRRALWRAENEEVPTSWDESWKYVDKVEDESPADPEWAGQTNYRDDRTLHSDTVTPRQLWQVIEGIGGDNGYYSPEWMWWVRGVMDRVVGGPGLGGRRDRYRLVEGDRVDWWRVERLRRPRLLVLRAEMRVSGRAWLVQEAIPDGDVDDPGVTFRQAALFYPQGLLGLAYWWAVYPFHGLIFPAMARNIMRAARRKSLHPHSDRDRD